MKLLLLPHGLSDEMYDFYRKEITGGRTNLKVALIPTASDKIEWIPDPENPKVSAPRIIPEEQIKHDAWWNNAREEFIRKGYDTIIVDLKEDPEHIREKLENVDLVEVGGGDVNYLLEWARKSKLDTYLKDLLDKGVIYVGVSAGSMLPQPDIGFTWWEADDPSDHAGLGIVNFVTVGASRKEDGSLDIEKVIERKRHLQSIMDFPWEVYILQGDQGIEVDGDRIEHLGHGEKIII